jgi:hypothetical protein
VATASPASRTFRGEDTDRSSVFRLHFEVVPADGGGVRDVPIYMNEGPWAQRPPKGRRHTTADKSDELKRASMTLVPS